MDGHVKVLGIIYIVLGFIAIIGGLGLFAIIAGAGAISGDRTAMLTTGIVGTVLAGFAIIMSVPAIIAGFGLLNHRSWARVLAILLSIVNLPVFPIGTAIGIYTLWVLLHQETTPLFAHA